MVYISEFQASKNCIERPCVKKRKREGRMKGRRKREEKLE